MYDKKTWVVVSLCSVLMATHLYFSNQQATAQRIAQNEKAKQEQFLKEAEAKKNPAPVTDTNNTPAPAAPVTSDEVISNLETADAIFHFSNKGGGVKNVELKKHLDVGENSKPVVINAKGTQAISSLLENGAASDDLNYVIEGQTDKSITFKATTTAGVTIKKSYLISPNVTSPGMSYMLECMISFQNDSKTEINLSSYALSLGSAASLKARETDAQTTFFYQNDNDYKYQNATKFSKSQTPIIASIEKNSLCGISNQFFATVIQPTTPYAANFTTSPFAITFANKDSKFHGLTAAISLPATIVPVGQTTSFGYKIFTGPKDNSMLRKMGGSWGELMNYGWWTVVSRFLNFGLHAVHYVVGKISNKWSWGFSIIILTILVRTAIWPLYNKSNRSMKRMTLLKPEMDKLREKYKDDPSKMNMETMKLYKKYGVNPVGGCLPMLLQIPIFFGYYRMLQYAVELRHESFLWIHDLSAPDTVAHLGSIAINPMPIIMTISSFFQMQMMPAAGDKAQQTMMKFMPFMFLFFCYDFASALSLYWTVQNVFGIFQTWLSKKLPEPELKEKDLPQKKSFMERMIEKQQEMERNRANGGSDNMRDVTPKKPRGPKTGG